MSNDNVNSFDQNQNQNPKNSNSILIPPIKVPAGESQTQTAKAISLEAGDISYSTARLSIVSAKESPKVKRSRSIGHEMNRAKSPDPSPSTRAGRDSIRIFIFWLNANCIKSGLTNNAIEHVFSDFSLQKRNENSILLSMVQESTKTSALYPESLLDTESFAASGVDSSAGFKSIITHSSPSYRVISIGSQLSYDALNTRIYSLQSLYSLKISSHGSILKFSIINLHAPNKNLNSEATKFWKDLNEAVDKMMKLDPDSEFKVIQKLPEEDDVSCTSTTADDSLKESTFLQDGDHNPIPSKVSPSPRGKHAQGNFIFLIGDFNAKKTFNTSEINKFISKYQKQIIFSSFDELNTKPYKTNEGWVLLCNTNITTDWECSPGVFASTNSNGVNYLNKFLPADYVQSLKKAKYFDHPAFVMALNFSKKGIS